MCIQDNPRYVNLVKLGMPNSTIIEYTYMLGECSAVAWLNDMRSFFSVSNTPEKVLSILFDKLEKYYAITS
jgi:hypothetical protein